MSKQSLSGIALRDSVTCDVCGDVANTKHYGIYACNGCKGFFRRSVYQKRNYTCRHSGSCQIAKEHRNSCRACRLKLCLEKGMNPRAIQQERDLNGKRSVVSDNKQMLSPSEHSADAGQRPTLLLTEAATQTDDDQNYGNGNFHCELSAALLEIYDRVRASTSSSECDVKLEADCIGEKVSFATVFEDPTIVHPRTKLCTTAEKVATSEEVVDNWHRCFVLFIDWIKSLMDFTNLVPADQLSLAKNRFVPWIWWIHAHDTIKSGCDGLCYVNGTYFPRQRNLQLLSDVTDCVGYFIDHLVTPMKELNVDKVEYCLICMICLFAEDANLTNSGRQHVNDCRDKYITALFNHQMKRNSLTSSLDAATRLTQLLLLVTVTSKLTLMVNDSIQFSNLFDKVEWSKIAMEIHTTS